PSAFSETWGSANSGLLASVVGSTVSMWLGGCAACSAAPLTIVPRKSTTSPAAAHIPIPPYRSTCMAGSAGRATPEEHEVHADPAQREQEPVERDDGQGPSRVAHVRPLAVPGGSRIGPRKRFRQGASSMP